MSEFIPGQRWISNTEIQLGLGTIIDADLRTVTLYFAASDETRIYAQQDAPLTRIIYKTGETIKSISGQTLAISDIIETKGLVEYSGSDESGKHVTWAEKELDHYVKLNRPSERLFSGQIDLNRWFELRFQTIEQLNQLSNSDLSGLTGCRTALIPHQLYIAHEVANRYAPRVLLADEVGLGKTIEAGLIIHHQLLNERAQRVLIVVPETLLHQWLLEMLRRFNLMFSLFDQQRCQAITEHNTDNPFLSEQLILCSLEFLAQNEQYVQHALEGEWDLLVVDEAHHLQWTPEHVSHEYQLIQKLAWQVQGLLLLTATPEQLGIESHFARLHLLDPDRFPELDTFMAEEQGYRTIAHAIDALLSHKPFDENIRQTLEQALKEEQDPEDKVVSQNSLYSALENLTQNDSREQQQARQLLIEHLLDRHGTGRVLFRNTRSAISGFPQRQVFTHPQQLPEEYQLCIKHFQDEFGQTSELDDTESQFSNLVLYPELLYQLANSHSRLYTDWTQIDPRLTWLGEWLLEARESSTHPAQLKTLVITANAQTAIDLASALHRQWGIYCATFHEGMSLIERDRAAAFFADMDNGTPVLICSEIGSEGRNFQFAHKLVLFDLSVNPDLQEQRIGRLDRIGQSRTIQIHIPYLNDSAQEVLCHWYHQGLNAFEQTCPVGHKVFEQLKTELYPLLMQPDWYNDLNSSNAWQTLLVRTQALHTQLNQALNEGRDKLLEYNSCRQPQADLLKEQADDFDDDKHIINYMDALFDAFGIEHSEHSEGSYIIRPGENMINQFPGLPEDGMTITYHRDIALANEDWQFFNWEHPMVRTAMDMVQSSEMGNTAITTLNSRHLPQPGQPLKAGTLLLECLFILDTATHNTLQATRYLPGTSIRILINEHGQELTDSIAHRDIIPSENAINQQTAQQIIKIKEMVLVDMIQRTEQLCALRAPDIIAQAYKASENLLQNEMKRLKALARVNPNIREDEINFYQQQQHLLDKLFEHICPRLDALRVIIVT